MSRARRGATLRRRLGWALAVAGILVLVVLTISVVALVRVLSLQEEVTDGYFEAVSDADTAYVALLDADVAVRSYTATGNTTALEAYNRIAGLGDTITVADPDLLARVRGDDALQDAAHAANGSASAWLLDYAGPAIDATAQDGAGSVQNSEQMEGLSLFAEARADASDYLTALQASRQDTVDALDRWSRVLFGSVLVLVLSALAVGVALWVCLRLWVTDPLARLAHRVRRVSSGNLEKAVVTSGPAEIADLAQDVERMRVELVRQVEEISASHADAERSHELLAERTDELERSNRDLEQFAYVASHDLQEPLRKVASFTQLLKKRYGGELDERADQYIEFAVDGAKRMQRLIQDLLGFSRVGRTGNERVDVDLESELGVVLEDLSETIGTTRASITHDRLPVVVGERALLRQLLANLVGNALKFRDPERDPVVHVSVSAHPERWEIAVRDNGIGIDAQYAERVFVIFQRLHAKDVYEGTGIGLALCKRIVEHHGGQIWIEPTAVGATVRLTLARESAPVEVGYARADGATGDVDAEREE